MLYVKQQGSTSVSQQLQWGKETQGSHPHCSRHFTGPLSTYCEPHALLTGETPRTKPSPCLKKRTFWWDRESPQNKIQVKLSVSGGGKCCEKYRREGEGSIWMEWLRTVREALTGR